MVSTESSTKSAGNNIKQEQKGKSPEQKAHGPHQESRDGCGLWNNKYHLEMDSKDIYQKINSGCS